MLLTAALKVHGLILDPYGQDNFLALPWLQVLTIEVEVLLGLWLLSGIKPALAWWTTLALFVVLTVISFTLAWQGQASCGCFGKVEVNPWYTFFFDMAIVAVMVLLPLVSPVRKIIGEQQEVTTAHSLVNSAIFQITSTTLVIVGLVVLGFTLFTKNPWATLARLRGETLSVQPAVTQVGEGSQGESRVFQVILQNYSEKPIRVVGGTTSCTCVATADLPLTIPAGENKTINVKINFSGSLGKFLHHFVLYSDANKRLTIARFSGIVTTVDSHVVKQSTSEIQNTLHQAESHVEVQNLVDNQGDCDERHFH
ncbi:MAG: DUF1573 domain-containing protein [Gemmatales bacterium]